MKKIMGYRREDGKFGLRNKVIIIPSVHCANKVCENIARKCNGAVYTTISMVAPSLILMLCKPEMF